MGVTRLLSLQLLILSLASAAMPARAAVPGETGAGALARQLADLRREILDEEKKVIDALKDQRRAKERIQALRVLMDLLAKEKGLGERRLTELQRVLGELEGRRKVLHERVAGHQAEIRERLAELGRSREEAPAAEGFPASESEEAPRRRVLAHLVDRSLKSIEAMRVDLADADYLESKIAEERIQIEGLLDELKEREELLKFHKQLQADVLRRKYDERLSELENYRNLKDAESHVSELIGQFNARVEFEKIAETERSVSRAVLKGDFLKHKGALALPVAGKVVSRFGKAYDAGSRLQVFRKGIEIEAGRDRPVSAIFAGQVAYAGVLPKYGSVMIVDHGANYYSLVGNLGRFARKKGDWVAAGEEIAATDAKGAPLYFEIRSRNVPVNPLQWVAN